MDIESTKIQLELNRKMHEAGLISNEIYRRVSAMLLKELQDGSV